MGEIWKDWGNVLGCGGGKAKCGKMCWGCGEVCWGVGSGKVWGGVGDGK